MSRAIEDARNTLFRSSATAGGDEDAARIVAHRTICHAMCAVLQRGDRGGADVDNMIATGLCTAGSQRGDPRRRAARSTKGSNQVPVWYRPGAELTVSVVVIRCTRCRSPDSVRAVDHSERGDSERMSRSHKT